MRLLVLLLALLAVGRAAEPLLKSNDVIALIGGEDMVVADEMGFLETLLHLEFPEHRLKVRSLAWEGDTVFEQRRDLNYPTLAAQLDRMGATVVLCQFGQIESLAGEARVPEFLDAYRRLVDHLSRAGAKPAQQRRVLILPPNEITQSPPWAPDDVKAFEPQKRLAVHHKALSEYSYATRKLAREPNIEALDLGFGDADVLLQRDGLHFNETGHELWAWSVARRLQDRKEAKSDQFTREQLGALRQLVQQKNRLWFHYTRPQNWAFLAGDRTSQPSSRDHVDKNKRWFPEEMEQFVPLIEAKEKEIWEAAAKGKGGAK